MASEELSPTEAAARIGATTRSVQRWIASGRLPARRVGGRWRVASDAIDAFVSDQRRPTVDGAGVRPIAIRTLFIANRGEIAARIARTCKRLGIHAVTPTVDGPDALDLLDPDAVVVAARAAGADAVHPGFGFLAENADFAERVETAGMRWVGPPPPAIRAMGDKAAARRLAAELGVPVLAGYDDADQSDAALSAAASRIGFPLLVKPSAGGGGKGMRIVREPARLLDSLAAARREATGAFGDDRLILERLVEGGRHIEIQVLFDAFGSGVHLGERDCSIQRRHQKVLEEAPSPAVDAALRDRLGDAALTLGRAVGYVSAGTCEFLVDDRGRPAFLEMNTRLQVEHPVTELVTGRDLVADQLRIAAGERLALAPGAGAATGHAVEVRLYAEDAEAGFLPATGRVEGIRWPAGDGVRIDAGIALGDVIGGRFDPMLAKIVAWAPDRPAALERLARALDETVVLGVVTNLRFLRWLVRQPVVLDGQARTDTLDRIWPPDDWAARATVPDDAWAIAASALVEATVAARPADPWAGGWRLNAAPSVVVESEGTVRSVRVDPARAPGPDGSAGSGASDGPGAGGAKRPGAGGGAGPGAGGVEGPGAGGAAGLRVDDPAGGAQGLRAGGAAGLRAHDPAGPGAWRAEGAAAMFVQVGDQVHVDVAGRSVAFRLAPPPDVDAAARAAAHRHVEGTAGGPVDVRSPMPGAILTVHVADGQEVEAGDPIVTLEAMKMEHVVSAPLPGRVAEIGVRPSDQVTRGQLLAVIEP